MTLFHLLRSERKATVRQIAEESETTCAYQNRIKTAQGKLCHTDMRQRILLQQRKIQE